ncbi:efflux RND transporter periplasmic adaptor subunit [Rivibacter subsaxonicus]|uniref:Multidrug efflux system membrane fusion protein n=1 Tax=Rivibacter subsaxonicus TaxID=457575 RepID=A0A4Q7VXB9_9BURK|nr:efflux RND transporter periplasmic adaptor subunit [Rivibacter subsaxonicus]RZU01185.1 multidrug efflux system membrane fusion protein [Rivibacter subsaxonicus]
MRVVRRVAIVSPLLALLALAGCSRSEGPPHGGPQAAPVGVVAAVKRPVREIEEFTGRLEPVESVEIRPRVGGTIEKLSFREGSYVKAGDPLFTLDAKPYAAEVARAEAQVASALAQGEYAKTELARAQKLLDAKAVSRQEFDQLTSGERTTDASLKAARAALQTAQLNLGYTRVLAPISGRVSRAFVTVGNLVDDKTVLTTIVRTDRVFAYFDASERTYLSRRNATADKGALKVRMGLANEAGHPHEGTIDFVDNRLNASSGTIRTRAVFDNSKGQFTPGLFARVLVTGGEPVDAVLVPDRAIGTDQTKRFVFVVGADNVPQFRPVQLGALQDGMRVIDSGLKAGEMVVVEGLQRVRPGMPITPEKLAVDPRGMPLPPQAAPPAAPASKAG